MTRPQLAKAIGRSYQHVANLELELNTADPAVFYRIAEVLGAQIGDVMKSPSPKPVRPRPAPEPTSVPQRPVAPPRPTRSPTRVIESSGGRVA